MSDLTKKIAQKEDFRGLDFHPLQNRDLEQTLIYVKLLSYVIMADGKLQKEEKERFSIVVSNLGLDPEECLNGMDDLQAEELEELCNGLKDRLFQTILMVDAHFISKIGKDEKKILDQIVSYCNISGDTINEFSQLNQLFDSLLKSIEKTESSLSEETLDETEHASGNSNDDGYSYSKIIADLKNFSGESIKDPIARDITLYFFVIMKYKLGKMTGSLKKYDPDKQVKKFIEATKEMVNTFIDKNINEVLVAQREELVKKILKDTTDNKKDEKLTKPQISPSVFKQFNKVLFDDFPQAKRSWTTAEKKAYHILEQELRDTKIVVESVKFEEERTGCLASIIAFFISGLVLSPWLDSHEWVCVIPWLVAIFFWKIKNNKKTLQGKNSKIFDEKVAPAMRSSIGKAIPAAIEKSAATISENYKIQIAQFEETAQILNKVILKIQRAKGEK